MAINNSKILVVDDNLENIKILGNLLRQYSFQAGFATNGEKAIEILKNNSAEYDLLLLDVNMPGMDGYKVCEKIRENHELKDIPVIFLTANAETEYIVKGFEIGGQDYVTKPFYADELISRIKTHLELKNNREQLKQMNMLLEEKVKERTLELENANKKLEEANQELMQLDESKTEFLRLLNHELNTPLVGILGYAGILREELESTEYQKQIEALHHSAQRLKEFTDASLIFAEMRTKPELYGVKYVDIHKIIYEVIEMLQSIAVKKNLQLITELKADKSLIHGSEKLLNMCLFHIIKNAVIYTHNNGTVAVMTNFRAGRLIFTVRDTGPGFTERALKSLFKPFGLGQPHVDKTKGLGLALVKLITDYHKAEITVSNSQNTGAIVSVEFPDLN